MNHTMLIPLIFILQIIYWFIGRQAAKDLNEKSDYFLAGKNVRFFPLMMTFLATQVGGGVILGAADEAYHFGWLVFFYPLGIALGLIALGLGIGSRLSKFSVSTIAQIFEVFYRSKQLKKVASVLSIISLFMVLVAQITASSKFLMNLGFTNTPLFIVFWGIVVLYTAQGGLCAVISTDKIQAVFFTVVLFVCFGFVLYTNPSVSKIPMPNWGGMVAVSSKLWGWLLMPMLFMVIEQDMGQRCFAGASSRVTSRASLFAGIGTFVVCSVPIFFGCLAKFLGLEIPEGSSVFMAAVIKLTGPWMSAFIGCAILAAIISTVTSLINAISSNLSNDFDLSFRSKKNEMYIIRITAGVISCAAIFSAFHFDSVVDLLIQSYELSVSCLFISIFLSLFKRQGYFLSALLSVICGAIGFFIFRMYSLGIPREIASILFSFLGYILGEIIVCRSNRMKKVTSEKVQMEES